MIRSASFDSTERESRFQQLKAEIHEKLIGGIDLAASRTANPNRLREELRRGAEQLSRMHSDLLSQAERQRLIDELVDETLGLGPLEPLMRDPTVSDILVNGPNCVYVERAGILEQTNIQFRDNNHLVDIVRKLAGRVGRRIDESSPMVDARLHDGSRLNAVIPPLALDGALVSIRRFSSKPITAKTLINSNSATPMMLEFLSACVRARLNILISGGTGSGKTTLLNLLSGFVPSKERIATIEDAAELRLQQPHVARMETRAANLEGRGQVTARDLLCNALRMRPDRIIMGECRGAEAFDMLQAMNTGHDGGMSTIHSNDAREAISRLEMLVSMATSDLPMWFIHRQIASAIHMIVHVSRMPGGERKIVQISEVTGVHGENINMHDLFVFRQTGMSEEGRTLGQFEAKGIVPQCIDRLERNGLKIPRSYFRAGTFREEQLDGLRRTR
ncbi:CpaF family protein [Rhodopirellula sp. JC740]|uniref:CpaF family protein n=1 Tax=Rhodopirellula halodulae TaxID=2894198 RepID=A0ABS8NHS9_9BACT|nr:CpaF family protein [Rhodopirellula sp. JC740]MCC9643086.1 CpaF family protein [Rhodopirellula sp. JC740]